jgi:cytochrome c-type biogenesis protein CcmH
MLLWLLFAVLTAAVIAVVLRPLGRAVPTAAAETDRAADVALYKAQLAELDADLARGVVAPADAEVARREIARRLLARAEAAPADTPAAVVPLRAVALGLGAVLPIAAIATYLALGAPLLPDQPLAERRAAPIEKQPVGDLIARVEARLQSNPNDGQGWDVIAPVYARLDRWADAANAYGRALRLLGETPNRLAGFAEATVMAADGVVSDAARAAFVKLLVLDPARPEPRFWLALAKEQDGKRAEAAADYRALLASGPPDAEWRGLVQQRLAALERPPADTAKAAPGPTKTDIEAAAKLPDADRAAMIRGMVDGLAARLAQNPNDPEGWQRLVRAYAVLGDRDKALASLAQARSTLSADPKAQADLTALAKSLGLGS